MHSIVLALSAILWSELGWSSFNIPTNLSAHNRDRVTEIIALGNSTKLNSNPYPLGGYSGVELSYSIEQINTQDISRLGSTSNTQRDLTYSRLTVGKGLYNNLDIFAHFIPYTEAIGYSEYGGLLRWCFYQAAFIPASFSVVLHANASNLTNAIFSQSRGIDFMAGLNSGNLAFYLGFGQIWGSSVFVKTLNSRDEIGEQKDQRSSVTNFHLFAGASFDWEPYFFAIQADQYTQTTFAGKLGLRF